MRTYFAGLSLKRKILYSYILFVGISGILFFIYSIQGIRNETEKSKNYIQNFNRQISQNMDVTISNMDRFRFLHFMDAGILPMLKQPDADKDAAVSLYDSTYLQNAINHMTNMNQYIVRATIVTKNGDVYSNVITNQEEYLNTLSKMAAKLDWENKKRVCYTNVYDSSINQLVCPIVTSISRMYSIGQDEPEAMVYVDLNFKAVKNSFDEIVKKDRSQNSMLLFGNDNVVNYQSPDLNDGFLDTISIGEKEELERVLHEESALKEPHLTRLSFHGREYMVSVMRNDEMNWKIMNFMSMSVIYSNVRQGMQGFFLMMGLVMIMTLILCLILPKQISRPVGVLAEYMSEVDQGYVSLIREEDYNFQGEMGALIHKYNQMGERINNSIEKIYVQQLNQKQTELKMLQFQINPHFLYNTLNTISSIASLEDMDEIVAMANGLSGMFRYNVKGSSIVMLSEEIHQVKNYLQIQSIRFLDKYDFQFDIAKEAESLKMLKFLIQPIVENALEHAFTKSKDKDILKLTVKMQAENDILISIYDNGVGIDEITQFRLNQEFSDTDTRTLVEHVDSGIGLHNVNARIKNYYGSKYGIRLESVPMEYTVVHILIRKLSETKESIKDV